MGWSYGAPTRVWTRGGRPVRFSWNGRIHTVQRVLEHWTVPGSVASAPLGERPPLCQSWRVRAGTAETAGVYELRYDAVGNRWLLMRV